MSVWILMALLHNGHAGNYAVPTLEFRDEQHCKAAQIALTNAALTRENGGRFSGYCVKVEK